MRRGECLPARAERNALRRRTVAKRGPIPRGAADGRGTACQTSSSISWPLARSVVGLAARAQTGNVQADLHRAQRPPSVLRRPHGRSRRARGHARARREHVYRLARRRAPRAVARVAQRSDAGRIGAMDRRVLVGSRSLACGLLAVGRPVVRDRAVVGLSRRTEAAERDRERKRHDASGFVLHAPHARRKRVSDQARRGAARTDRVPTGPGRQPLRFGATARPPRCRLLLQPALMRAAGAYFSARGWSPAAAAAAAARTRARLRRLPSRRRYRLSRARRVG